jgi:hypothetical protein
LAASVNKVDVVPDCGISSLVSEVEIQK